MSYAVTLLVFMNRIISDSGDEQFLVWYIRYFIQFLKINHIYQTFERSIFQVTLDNVPIIVNYRIEDSGNGYF